MDIVGKRYLFFAISLIVILPGLIGLFFWGLPLAVDFTGGSLIEMRFDSGKAAPLADVREVYAQFGYEDAEVRSSGEEDLIIRTRTMDEATNKAIITDMESTFAESITVLRFDSVGPTIGREVTLRAAGAVALASIAILLYIWYAFRGVPNAHRYGVSAILAMLHDVAVVFGMQAFLSRFFGWEVDSLFLTALLTVIGFSVHDSIVVFDRIRENSIRHRRQSYEKIINDSTGKNYKVFPVVLFPGWFVEGDGNKKGEMWVLEPRVFKSFLANEKIKLSPEEVSLAAYHLSRHVRTQ